MNTFERTGRHQGIIKDESGKEIDRAHGRNAVIEMKERHGVTNYLTNKQAVKTMSTMNKPGFDLNKLKAECFEEQAPSHATLRADNQALHARVEVLELALGKIADAAYGTDTPKLRDTARAALAK